uniref:Elongation of very long chain fatty acids protein n=1 Tax=Chrysemys picta bellii TaxID=8478 RepID=A0A8C3FLZ7_CHRPI
MGSLHLAVLSKPFLIAHCICFCSDSRVRGWFLLDSYLPTFFLTVVYLLSIWLGTKFMKNRPAFSLRGHLIVYNLGVTVLSLYMLIEVSFLKCSTTSEKAKH